MKARAFAFAFGLVASLGTTSCKKEISCNPGDVSWGVQLVLEASDRLNQDDEGNSLPTLVRLYQLRGELALETIDFKTIWESEDVSELGEGFLSVEEITVYPGKNDLRTLPIEADATHVVAAGLFREPLGSSWYSTYEVPRLHPQVVCSKEPITKEYPDPCFYVFAERSQIAGGPTPPPGARPSGDLKCAPPGEKPGPQPTERKRPKKRKLKRDAKELEDPLETPDKPGQPESPAPDAPEKPAAPSVDR